MIVGIHQPQYLPWLGYFDKIDKADYFIFLDDVQFKKNEWQNRNKIKTAGSQEAPDKSRVGKTDAWQWLTVPVHYKFGQLIMDVSIDNQVDWKRKHLTSLEINYGKSAYFREYRKCFKEVYEKKWERFCELNIYLVEYLMKMLGINTPMKTASQINAGGEKTEKLVNICKALAADTYLSGTGAKEYLEIEKFEKQGIKVIFQEFSHPLYPQLYGKFIPNLSIVDLLFNCGPESLSILKKGKKGNS